MLEQIKSLAQQPNMSHLLKEIYRKHFNKMKAKKINSGKTLPQYNMRGMWLFFNKYNILLVTCMLLYYRCLIWSLDFKLFEDKIKAKKRNMFFVWWQHQSKTYAEQPENMQVGLNRRKISSLSYMKGHYLNVKCRHQDHDNGLFSI